MQEFVNLANQIGRLTAKPSLLRETLDNFEAIHCPDSALIAEDLSDGNDLVPQNRSLEESRFPAILQRRPISKTSNLLNAHVFERSCTCKHPRIQKSWTKAVLGATFGSQTIHAHRRGCPLFREEDEIIQMSLDISLMSRLVNKDARLSLSLQYGAGGMSVSPSLTLRGMKQRNSPVFALLKTLNPSEGYLSTSERISRMNEILPRITLLVQNRQASSHDVDENGQTVFDVRRSSSTSKDSANFLQVFFDRRSWCSDESRLANREPRDFFIKSLLNLGFSSNEELSGRSFGKG